jgi:hypothetical protein
MTAPQTTPLLLPSEYNAAVVSGAFTAATVQQQIRWIVQTSDYIQGACRRRFDERAAMTRARKPPSAEPTSMARLAGSTPGRASRVAFPYPLPRPPGELEALRRIWERPKGLAAVRG